MSSLHRFPPRKRRRSQLYPASAWLGQCKGPTARIIQQSQSLLQLQEILAKTLPEPLILHVQVMSLQNGRLSLATDGALWATQVRHRRQQILAQMSLATRQPLGQLEVKVSSLFAPPLVRKIQRQLSSQTRKQLLLTADHIDDASLSSALRRLADNAAGPAVAVRPKTDHS